MPRLSADRTPFPELLSCIAISRMRAADFERKYDLALERIVEEGLGNAAAGYIELKNGRRIVVMELMDMLVPRLFIKVPKSAESAETMDEVLADFGLTEEDFLWTIKDGEEGRYELYRTDDNGGRFRIAEFGDKVQAELAKERFEASQHKQAYWVERVEEE